MRVLICLDLIIFFVFHVANALEPRGIECNHPGADFDPTCWEKLNVSGFLDQWQQPYCTSDNTTNCCLETTEWSTCFLKLFVAPGYNCTSIALETCVTDLQLKDGIDSNIEPQVRYIVRNIMRKILALDEASADHLVLQKYTPSSSIGTPYSMMHWCMPGWMP